LNGKQEENSKKYGNDLHTCKFVMKHIEKVIKKGEKPYKRNIYQIIV